MDAIILCVVDDPTTYPYSLVVAENTGQGIEWPLGYPLGRASRMHSGAYDLDIFGQRYCLLPGQYLVSLESRP
jgi:hypothetical protein